MGDKRPVSGPAYLVHPIRAATDLCQPRTESSSGLERARQWIGAAVVAAVAYRYGGAHGVYSHYWDVLNAAVIDIIALTALTLITGCALLVWHPAGTVTGNLFLPFRVALTVLAAYLLSFWMLSRAAGPVGREVFWLYPLAFALLFNIRAFWLAVTGLCRAADAAPYFAPLLSPLYAWTLAIVATITTSADPTGIPASAAVLITWAGPVSLTAISCLTFPKAGKRPEERTLR